MGELLKMTPKILLHRAFDEVLEKREPENETIPMQFLNLSIPFCTLLRGRKEIRPMHNCNINKKLTEVIRRDRLINKALITDILMTFQVKVM